MLRRVGICLLICFIGACSQVEQSDSTSAQPASTDAFVRVENGQFKIGAEPYRYVGVNMWYGAYLGSTESDIGDRERLIKELDFLVAHGVTNLRVLGASEVSPLRDAVRPAISERGEVVRPDILEGLDFLLAEMAKRDMKAVIYVNNFWEWSGGMATYLYWTNGGEIVDPSDPAHPWPAFALFSSQFYRSEPAQSMFEHYLVQLLGRVNSITGRAYVDDPTIMSWQLGNEPRPGHMSVSGQYLPEFYDWIRDTTALIKSHAPKQLVSIGSEGFMGCIQDETCVMTSHTETGIDYMTFHMWLKNWGWFDATQPDASYGPALERAQAYIDQHLGLASKAGMPLVLEEFGMERDYGEFSTDSSTVYRNRYFTEVFERVENSASAGGPLVGTNIWAWGGFGVAQHEDFIWREGDGQFVGDPPQEAQGLNSVFAVDADTMALIKAHAQKLNALP